MRNPVSAFRSRRVLSVATVAVLAGLAAACSNSVRLQDRLFTGSTNNQKAIIGEATDQPMPAPISTGPAAVARAELPPPTTLASSSQPIALQGSTPTAAPLDGPYAWSAVGGTVITVAPGETLDNIAIKYGVPSGQILDANQLTSPSQVRPGGVLVIPRRVALAPEPSRSPVAPAMSVAKALPAAPPTKTGGATHVVQAGDTLYSISRRYGAKIDAVVALNGLAAPETIRVGQRLRLSADAAPPQAMAFAARKPKLKPQQLASAGPRITLASPAETAASGSPIRAEKPIKIPAVPAIPVESKEVLPTTAAASAAIDEAAAPASADGTSFRWPVRGRIISGFGSKPNGERNDGINLAVPEGTSVKAIEAGNVIYAGNELEGYGNLVLIRHADGWVSAYAHNKELLIKRGDKVRRGQTIARAGMSGSVSAPQVHFELRKGAKPVNPLDYLTG